MQPMSAPCSRTVRWTVGNSGLSRGERLAVDEITGSLTRIETLLIGLLHAVTDGEVPPEVREMMGERP